MTETTDPLARLRALIANGADRRMAETSPPAEPRRDPPATEPAARAPLPADAIPEIRLDALPDIPAPPLSPSIPGAVAQPHADIARLAARRSAEEPLAHLLAPRRERPSREALAALAEQLGFELAFLDRPVEKLVSDDLPLIACFDDGSSLILDRRQADGAFAVTDGGLSDVLPAEVLSARRPSMLLALVWRPAPPSEAIDATYGSAGARRTEAPPRPLVDLVAQLAIHDNRPLFLQLVLAAIVSNLLTIALPLFTMTVYDRVVPHMAMETLWALVIGVAIALGFDLMLRWVRLQVQDAVSASASATLQARLYRKIVNARLAETPRTAGGLTGALREIDALAQTVPALAVAVIVDLPFFVLVLLLMAYLGGWVVIAPILGFLALVAVHAYAHARVEQVNVEASRLSGFQSNVLTETVETIEAAKAAGAQNRLMRRWEDLTDLALHTSHRLKLWTGFAHQAAVVITSLVIVGVVVIGVFVIGAGLMTVGALTACTMLVGRALSPVGQLVGLWYRLQHLKDSAAPVEKILALPQERAGDGTRPLSPASPLAFAFKGVDFAFPGETLPTLHGVSLSIRPGEKVGIVGRTGSGKSTLLKLLPRFFEPTAGRILVDGHDSRQFDPEALRRSIAFMRQEPLLFDDTLRANIVFGLDRVDEAAFERAVALSGVKDFAARNPQGYGLRVGPRGERLSGGERQAVWLARTLLADARMVILDEPTAAMDSTLEQQVVRDLKRAIGDKTLIVATHRAAVLDMVDRLIWIDQGRVLADGPKAEVLRKLAGQPG